MKNGHRAGCPSKSPFKIMVHIKTSRIVKNLVSTCFDLRNCSSIASQFLRTRKPLHISHFHGYHYSQDHPHSWEALQKLHRRGILNDCFDLSLTISKLIKNFKLFFHPVESVRRKFIKLVLQKLTPPCSKNVPNLNKFGLVNGYNSPPSSPEQLLSFIPQLPCKYPDGRKSSVSK